MAHARGVICLAAARHGIPVWGFPPGEVKNAVIGHGRASKEQVQEMVQRLFSLPQRPTPNDMADALAIAVTGVYRHSGDQAFGRSGLQDRPGKGRARARVTSTSHD
jgi:crossover junction endodeoxyribonuclease RuvC